MLSSNIKKIIVLISISLITFVAWEFGLEHIYEKALVNITNPVIKAIKKDTHIILEESTNGKNYQFRVYTRVQGRMGNYPQETGSLMEPFVIILSWQLFLFFVLKSNMSFKLLLINTLSFIIIQMIFLIFLTGYYNSTIQQFLFDMMLDNFYIVALILIIKDNILYPVFRKVKNE